MSLKSALLTLLNCEISKDECKAMKYNYWWKSGSGGRPLGERILCNRRLAYSSEQPVRDIFLSVYKVKWSLHITKLYLII
jgi:hypothetical protein